MHIAHRMKKQFSIEELPLFQGLNSDELKQLMRIIRTREVAKGSFLFIQGDKATGFFVLLSGRVRIFKSSPDGREYTLHQIIPGQMFAEAAIFHGDTYPANAVAVEDGEVVFCPKEEFLQLLRQNPQISLKIIGGLSRWLREFALKLESVTLREVPARLAEYLLRLAGSASGNTVLLPVTKAELASELATTSETLSRSLKRLKLSGAIEVRGKVIELIDTAQLKDIASGEKSKEI